MIRGPKRETALAKPNAVMKQAEDLEGDWTWRKLAKMASDHEQGVQVLFREPKRETALSKTNAVMNQSEDSEGDWMWRVEIRTGKTFLAKVEL